jgi:hypothetical protein
MSEELYKRNWLTKVNIFRRPGELYLTRYVIFRCRLFSLYIHQFHLSDHPTAHDHPWWWLAIPLRKGYNEHFVDSTVKRRRVGVPAVRAPQEFHWVEIEPGTEGKVWTFFATGPRVRRWGFLTKLGWMYHKDYQNVLDYDEKRRTDFESELGEWT